MPRKQRILLVVSLVIVGAFLFQLIAPLLDG